MKFIKSILNVYNDQLSLTEDQKNAIVELQGFTDRQLSDIGLTRVSIREAVCKGL